MATTTEANLPADPNADNQQQTYGSLLDDSDALGIEEIDEREDKDPAEADDSEESDEQEAKEQAQEPTEPADDATVKLDGADVSLRELKDTFSTFRRKTEEYAQFDRAREQEARTAVANIHEQAAAQIVALAESVQQLVLPGIDRNALYRLSVEDPAQFALIDARFRMIDLWKNEALGKARDMWGQGEQQRTQASQSQVQARNALMQSEGEKLKGEKWFNDDFKAKAVAFCKRHGVPEQEARALPYAGAMHIINKAMKYDEAQRQLKAGKQPAQQTQVPSGAKGRDGTAQQRAATAFETAKKTGTRRDTARAYASLLGRS